MRSRGSAAIVATQASAFVLFALLFSIALPSNAHACRQDPAWCTCIDNCQDRYWDCRNAGGSGPYCINKLDKCQIGCDGRISDPGDPGTVDPVIVSKKVVSWVRRPSLEGVGASAAAPAGRPEVPTTKRVTDQ
jgi:hypothetical protein